MKDCQIFEEFLELARAIRRRGFSSKIVFATPNVTDYGEPPEDKSRIRDDLSALSGLYVKNLCWAEAEIGRP